MKVYLYGEERYPVFDPILDLEEPTGCVVEVDEDVYSRWKEVCDSYDAVQDEMLAAYKAWEGKRSP